MKLTPITTLSVSGAGWRAWRAGPMVTVSLTGLAHDNTEVLPQGFRPPAPIEFSTKLLGTTTGGTSALVRQNGTLGVFIGGATGQVVGTVSFPAAL